jgi:hypothetical protein
VPEPEVSTSAGAPNPGSGGAKVIDYTDVSASASGQPRGGADGKALNDEKEERPTSTLSLPAKLIKTEGSTDFRHPATAEDQRIVWLPKDRLGLVHEIERDLESHDILCTSEAAEMDDKGHVDVNMTAVEDIQHARREESEA